MEQISPEDKRFIIGIIGQQLPKAKILAFGSRILGNAERYSDMDVAVDNGSPITLLKLFELSELFSESELPYKIDLTDYNRVTPEFQKLIKKTGVAWK